MVLQLIKYSPKIILENINVETLILGHTLLYPQKANHSSYVYCLVNNIIKIQFFPFAMYFTFLRCGEIPVKYCNFKDVCEYKEDCIFDKYKSSKFTLKVTTDFLQNVICGVKCPSKLFITSLNCGNC